MMSLGVFPDVLAVAFQPESIGDPWRFWLMAVAAVVLFGMAKAGFGGGIGMVSTPMMIYACGGNSTLALGLMLPLLISCDYVAMLLWWRKWDSRNLMGLLPGMLLGVSVGAGVLYLFLRVGSGAKGAEATVTNACMALAIGLIAVVFVGMRVVRAALASKSSSAEPGTPAADAYRPLPWHGKVTGVVSGITSTLAHAAGPITTMFLLPQKMPKGRFVATTVMFYWVTNQVKLVPYIGFGLVNADNLWTGLSLLPAVIVGAVLGRSLHNRVNQAIFGRIVYGLLGAVGVHLCVKSIATLANL